MDTMKHFAVNFNKFWSGEYELEEISSVTIKRFVHEINLWRVPRDWPRFVIVLHIVIWCYMIIIGGILASKNLDELGNTLAIAAGVELSSAKWFFLQFNSKHLEDLIRTMNEKSVQLNIRAQTDPWIKRIRDQFYCLEMTIFILAATFSLIFVFAIFVQVLLLDPPQFSVPAKAPFSVEPGTPGFWVTYVGQLIASIFVTLCYTSTDLMIGNLYNQVILYLEVLNHDLHLMDDDASISTAEFSRHFCKFSAEFQSLRQLNAVYEKRMKWFLINNIVATLIAVTFSCIAFGIMVVDDVVLCVKPVMFFCYINITFFYWCWLGNRLKERSAALALSAYIFKEKASTISTQRLQLNFIHMVQSPLTIIAKPFFELNFDIFVTVLKTSYKFTTVFKNVNASHSMSK